MRNLCLIAVCSTAFWTTACSGPTSSSSVTTTSEGQTNEGVAGKQAALSNTGLIRFFNADPQRKSLSVYSQKKPVFSNIAYKSITPYQEAERGVSVFTLRADDKADLATNRRELFPGRHYTLFALPNKKREAQLESFSDNLGAIDPGQARVRLINATTRARDLDLFIQGTNTRILRGTGSGDILSIAEMYAADVEIRPDAKSSLKPISNLKVEPDKLYTFVAVDDDGKLDVVQIVDQLESK